MKRILSKIFMFLLIAGLATGCGGKNDSASNESKKDAKPIKVGLVSSSSGFGDGAFNDLTLKGVEKAKKDFGIEYDKVQIKAVGDIELSLRDMAATGDYDLVIGLTYEAIQAMEKVAKEFPDQKFALIDSSVKEDNVVSYMTKDEEASYLVGVAAAGMKSHYEDFKLSQDKKLGFIGGVDAPNIRTFYSGYAAGAKNIDKEIEVTADFVGGFTDVTTAKEIAKSMNQQGIDVIFHASGMSGNGLFQAAKENSTYAFGVNINQNSVEPKVIVGSMIKNVDVEAYNAIKSVVENKFKGEIIKLGLKENGVDLVTDGSEVKLPEDVVKSIKDSKEKIINGEIKVPSNMDELKEFEKSLK